MTNRSAVSTSWKGPYPLPLIAVTAATNYTIEVMHEMIPMGSPGDKVSVDVSDQLNLCRGYSVNLNFSAYCLP